jgi:hypothetical protein
MLSPFFTEHIKPSGVRFITGMICSVKKRILPVMYLTPPVMICSVKKRILPVMYLTPPGMICSVKKRILPVMNLTPLGLICSVKNGEISDEESERGSLYFYDFKFNNKFPLFIKFFGKNVYYCRFHIS